MTPARTAAHLSLAFAGAALVVIAAYAVWQGSMAEGLLVPLGTGPTVLFWLAACASMAFAAIAIAGRQWKPATAALLLLAVSLAPSMMLVAACIGGNCL